MTYFDYLLTTNYKLANDSIEFSSKIERYFIKTCS